MEHDVHQPAQRNRPRFWHAGDGLWIEHAVADDPKLPFLQLRHEHAAVWKKRETPGFGELPGHNHHADLVDFRRVEDERAIAERRALNANRRSPTAAPVPPAPPARPAPWRPAGAGSCAVTTAPAAMPHVSRNPNLDPVLFGIAIPSPRALAARSAIDVALPTIAFTLTGRSTKNPAGSQTSAIFLAESASALPLRPERIVQREHRVGIERVVRSTSACTRRLRRERFDPRVDWFNCSPNIVPGATSGTVPAAPTPGCGE